MVTGEEEELPLPVGPSTISNLRKQRSLQRLFSSSRARKVSKSTPSSPAGLDLPPSPQSPTSSKVPPPAGIPSRDGVGGPENARGHEQDRVGQARFEEDVAAEGWSGTSWLPQRLKIGQLHLPKRDQSMTAGNQKNLPMNGKSKDPTSPGLRAASATVSQQAAMAKPTPRLPTFPLVKGDSYDSLNMPYGFPSVPRARGLSNPSYKALPLPPQSPSALPSRPFTAAPDGHGIQRTSFHFDFGLEAGDSNQQEHSGKQPLQHVPSDQEVRASLRSAVTTNSSGMDTSATERSSVLTKDSSNSDLTVDYTRSPVPKDEGMTVDDAIGMYAAGFADDIVPSEDEADVTPLPVDEEQRRSMRIAEAVSDAMGPNLPLPNPPFAAEQRSSAAIMSGDAFRSSSPRPPSLLPPTGTRDRYGFRKATHHITVDQYDAWNIPYAAVQARRHKRWIAFMRDQGLSTDHPIRFPERSPKTQRFVRKGIPPAWRGAAWFFYAGGDTLLDEHPNLYTTLLSRATAGALGENDKELIERDLHRTFPDNIHFKPDPIDPTSPFPDPSDPSSPFHTEPPLVSSLRHVLHAFAVHSPKIGYCQSLNFLAGLLLLFLPEEKAFWMLHVITTSYLPSTHEISLEGANVDLWVLMTALKESNMPAVWAKLGGDPNNSLTPPDNQGGPGPTAAKAKTTPPTTHRLPAISLCATSWFMSLFVGSLPVESALRVWDLLFYDGARTIFRVALAIFKLGERDIRDVGDAVEVFQTVQALPRRLLDAAALVRVACSSGRGGGGWVGEEWVEEMRKRGRGWVRGAGRGEEGDGDREGDGDGRERKSGMRRTGSRWRRLGRGK
ncbi:hypothetical protein MMC08_008058 [Hypocenomyce scalaris]|nr:hypothetical protein [Hypocenomyce scalaris]